MTRSNKKKIFGITIPIFFIMWIALMVSSAGAARFPLSFASNDNLATGNLSIVPGNDTASSCLSNPCASLETRSKDDFEVSLSLFRSQIESPQPQTYYTDLVRIENPTNRSQQVNSVFVQINSGIASLGSLTVFYCTLPSKDPYDDSCAMFTMNDNVNSGYLVGKDIFPESLNPGSVGYIGAAGFANMGAKMSDLISFQILVNTGET